MPHKDPRARREYDREWRAKNRDQINAYQRIWRATHKDHTREYQRKYKREWQKNNKDKVLGYYTKYRDKHREKIRVRSRNRVRPDWYRRNAYVIKLAKTYDISVVEARQRFNIPLPTA